MRKVSITKGENPVCLRNFRFILKSKLFEGLEHAVKSVNVNLINKKLLVNVYEIFCEKSNKTIPDLWIERLETGVDELTLTFYDGYGKAMKSYTFYYVKILENKFKADYAEQKILTRDFEFVFDRFTINYERKEKDVDS